MHVDFHIHSNYSPDSRSTLENIIKTAREKSLDAISITDHNTMAGNIMAKAISEDLPIIIPGAEYSSDMGHLLAYFIETGLESLSLARDKYGRFRWQDIVESAHDQGGIVFLAHPFKRIKLKEINYADLYPREFLLRLDGLEIFNSRAAMRSFNSQANEMAKELHQSLRLGFTGGSDAHLPSEIGNTIFMCEGNTADDIRRAMLSGSGTIRAKASSLDIEAVGQINKALRQKAFHRLPKYMAKWMVGKLQKNTRGDWIDFI